MFRWFEEGPTDEEKVWFAQQLCLAWCIFALLATVADLAGQKKLEDLLRTFGSLPGGIGAIWLSFEVPLRLRWEAVARNTRAMTQKAMEDQVGMLGTIDRLNGENDRLLALVQDLHAENERLRAARREP